MHGSSSYVTYHWSSLFITQVEKVNKFTQTLVEKLRADLTKMQTKSANAEKESKATKDVLLKEAHRIGDDFLALEKFVNLNYMGFHKILKKHDKMIPQAPCRQFYIAHLHQQPWVQGNYSDLLVSLSNVYSKLRGDTSGVQNDDSAQVRGVERGVWGVQITAGYLCPDCI